MEEIKLLQNSYKGDDVHPARQMTFTITENCLNDYLKETEDNRSVQEFLDTYDSDESEVIYQYAEDDGRILSESITYSDEFEEDYKDFIKRTQMYNPDMKAEEIATKEDYYNTVFAIC